MNEVFLKEECFEVNSQDDEEDGLEHQSIQGLLKTNAKLLKMNGDLLKQNQLLLQDMIQTRQTLLPMVSTMNLTVDESNHLLHTVLGQTSAADDLPLKSVEEISQFEKNLLISVNFRKSYVAFFASFTDGNESKICRDSVYGVIAKDFIANGLQTSTKIPDGNNTKFIDTQCYKIMTAEIGKNVGWSAIDATKKITGLLRRTYYQKKKKQKLSGNLEGDDQSVIAASEVDFGELSSMSSD